MPDVAKTNFSLLAQPGHPNVGGWATRLTDVCSTAKEHVGAIRREGVNEYMYVQIGTGGASRGNFLSVSTAYTDTNSVVPPFALTANGVSSTGTIARAMALCTCDTGVVYAWALVEGVGTAVAHSNTSVTQGNYVGPSTNTANTVECGGVAYATAVGRALETAATGAADVDGFLVFYQFKR